MEVMLISIALGLLVSLLFVEFLGISPGGMIPLGYIALHLGRPLDVALTLAASLITLLVVRALSRVMVIYGRRQVAAMILLGFVVGAAINLAVTPSGTMVYDNETFLPIGGIGEVPGLEVIGFIIPGLVAVWFDRQGVITTICGLVTGSIVVYLLLVVLVPERVEFITAAALLSPWRQS